METRNNACTTVREASQYIRLSRSKVYELMDSGQLPYAKHGRARRIRWCDLDAFIEGNLVGTPLAKTE